MRYRIVNLASSKPKIGSLFYLSLLLKILSSHTIFIIPRQRQHSSHPAWTRLPKSKCALVHQLILSAFALFWIVRFCCRSFRNKSRPTLNSFVKSLSIFPIPFFPVLSSGSRPDLFPIMSIGVPIKVLHEVSDPRKPILCVSAKLIFSFESWLDFLGWRPHCHVWDHQRRGVSRSIGGGRG